MRLGRFLRMAPLVVALLTLSLHTTAVTAGGYQQQSEELLTNASVIKLVRAGFGEKTVISIIGARPVRFDLSPDKLIELKKRGVSEKVILAMLSRDLGNTSLADDADWGDDDAFFGGKNGAATGGGGGAAGGSSSSSSAPGVPQDPGEVNIFGSSGGSKGRVRSRSGGVTGDNDTETLGSASVRILRPPSEAGGGGAGARLERTPSLTNESIVELINAGFSEGTIIRRIELSPAEFDLAPAKLEELRRRRVTGPIIEAMRAAMSDDTPHTSNPQGRTAQ